MTLPVSNKTEIKELMERLQKRANEDRQCEANNLAVAEALDDQLVLFEGRTGAHNVYAVRMAVDHQQSAKRDGRYAADLEQAVALLQALQEEGK